MHRESLRVRTVLEHRYRVYRVKLRERKKQIAAINAANARAAAATPVTSTPSWSAPSAPSVGVVAAPPVTNTHTDNRNQEFHDDHQADYGTCGAFREGC